MKRKNQRGSSEIWFLVVVILFVFAIVFGRTCARMTKGNDDAIRQATIFANRIPKVTGIECATYDSDGDGYISCMLFRDGVDPLFIECAGGFTFNEGCRAPKFGGSK